MGKDLSTIRPSGTTALIDGTRPLVAGALAGPLLGQSVSRTQWIGGVPGTSARPARCDRRWP